MSAEAGAAFVEVTTGEDQAALPIKKEAYKAARKYRDKNPIGFDPSKGWAGMLPQLDFDDGFKLTHQLNKDAYTLVVFREGLWGPPSDPIYAEKMNNHKVRSLLPSGNLKEKTFGASWIDNYPPRPLRGTSSISSPNHLVGCILLLTQ